MGDHQLEVLVNHRLVPFFAAAAVALYSADAHAQSVGAIDVIAAPTEIGPGGSTTLTIIVRDETGAGLVGAPLNLMAPAGSASTIVDYGNGTYSTVYTAPSDATGSIMLVVTNTSGSVRATVNLSIDPNKAATTVPVPKPVKEARPVKEAKPVKEPRAPREPRAPSDTEAPTARLRVGVGGGTYSYSQVRTPGTESPLWPEDVYLGGEQGEAGPANPLAFDGRFTAWVPAFPYVGVDASIRLGSHKVAWPGASAPIPDLVPHGSANLALRYPFAFSGGQLSVGAKAGWLYGEFITFQTGETERDLDYPNIPVQSFGTGADLTAEFTGGSMPAYFNLSLLGGWRGGVMYSKSVNLEAGMRPASSPGIGLAASVQYTQRSIDIVSAGDTGSVLGVLSDETFVVLVGPTFEF